MFTPIRLAVRRVHRVLGVDEGADAAAPLRLGDDVVDERRLPRGLRAEDLDDAAARQAADAEGDVQRERARGDGRDGDLGLVAHLHDRALAVLPLDLAQRGVEGLFACGVGQGVNLPEEPIRESRTAPRLAAAPNDREPLRTD